MHQFCELAHQISASACWHYSESCYRDYPSTTRIFCDWRAITKATGSARYRRCHKHARVDGQPGDVTEVRCNAPRHLRVEVLFYPRDRWIERRKFTFGGVGKASHQEDDRCRNSAGSFVG